MSGATAFEGYSINGIRHHYDSITPADGREGEACLNAAALTGKTEADIRALVCGGGGLISSSGILVLSAYVVHSTCRPEASP